MTVAGQINTSAYFDPVTLMRVGKGFAALPGLAAARLANAVEDAVGLRLVRLPITVGEVIPERPGNRYDGVKGSCQSLCFAGWLEFCGVRTRGASKR